MRINAKATRSRANAQANNIEDTAAKNQLIAADNLARQQTNNRAQVGAVNAARASSGFTSEGSGNAAQESAQTMLDRYTANMAMSASIAMTNSVQRAIDIRRQGEVDAVSQEEQARIYHMQAKNIQRSANVNLAVGIASAATSAITGFMDGGDIGSTLLQAANVGDMAYHASATFTPYTAAFSADANSRKNNWGGLLSVISGNIPYKTPEAAHIFSQYI